MSLKSLSIRKFASKFILVPFLKKDIIHILSIQTVCLIITQIICKAVNLLLSGRNETHVAKQRKAVRFDIIIPLRLW